MPIYMKVEGATGPLKAAPYAGWFDLRSFAPATTVRAPVGYVGSSAAKPDPSSEQSHTIVVTRIRDDASHSLSQLYLTGELTKVTVAFVRTSGDSKTEFLRITLDQVLFSSYNVQGGASDVPVEAIALNFETETVARPPGYFDPDDLDQIERTQHVCRLRKP